MAFAVAGPVHADRRQPVERRRHRRPEPIRDPAGDVARGAPRHVQEPLTVFRFATPISHAHSASKSLVNRLPGSAHGTQATTTPHSGQSTRGIEATSPTRQQPKS